MQNGTTIALSRLMAQQRSMDVTANNIANVNTPGFRTGRMLFNDWLLREPGISQAPGDRLLAFTQDRATYRDQQPGPITTTGNPLDLAISDSSGYFQVRTANGVRLTRAGHFALSATGTVVNEDGDTLLDRGGQALTLTPTDTRIDVAADGTMSSENGAIGTIGIVAPRDPMQLTPEGNHNLVAATPTAPVALPRILQGAVEGSNVQAVAEITRMTNDLREFQFVSQYVQGESDRRANAIEKLAQRPV